MNCRQAVAIALVIFLALEILPCSFLHAPTMATNVSDGFACCIEPLQVCDNGDHLLGALANLTVLVPGATVLILIPEVHTLVPDRTVFIPDGFRPSIDHPPQLAA
jgi:hypothetical protein